MLCWYTPKYTPILHKSKSFPCRAREARIPKVQILHVQILHIGGLYGVVFCKSGSAGIGLYCRPLKFSTSDFP